MSRRRTNSEHNGQERWLVSYADFITLLFAFFVVMFASSQTDRSRTARMEESMKRALSEDHLVQKIAGILGGVHDDEGKGNAQMKGPGGDRTGGPKAPANLKLVQAELESALKIEIDQRDIAVTMEARGLVISFHQAAFFPSAGDEIPRESYGTLEKVARILQRVPNPVRFEGHTDSQPLRENARFRTNWELSAARAIAMMEAMVACCGLERGRFSIGGYAENAPVSSNDTDEGRARNRRVDIVILNAEGLRVEPASAAAKGALP
jgi:chemotaxis protein MotB